MVESRPKTGDAVRRRHKPIQAEDEVAHHQVMR